MVDSTSFEATVKHMLLDESSLKHVAGIASVNYSLSPYPTHPKNPSPPSDPNQPPDPSRMARHPDHIFDVLAAISYLQHKAGFGSNCMLIGHSCGATLALQACMDAARWTGTSAVPRITKPRLVLGLNGLYNLPKLIQDPGEKHKQLVPIYESFMKLAFGDSHHAWHSVSPCSVQDWIKPWGSGNKVILAQSKEDTLVPYAQTQEMLDVFQPNVRNGLLVEEKTIDGDHNDIWVNGDQLAALIGKVVKTAGRSY